MYGPVFRAFVREHAANHYPDSVISELFAGYSAPFVEDGQTVSWQAMVVRACVGSAAVADALAAKYIFYMGNTRQSSGMYINTVAGPEVAAGDHVVIPGESETDQAILTPQGAEVIIRGCVLQNGEEI